VTEQSTDYDPRREAAGYAAGTAMNVVGMPAFTGGVPAGAMGSGARRPVLSPDDLTTNSKVDLGPVFRGVEGGTDRRAAIRHFAGGDIGDGVYVTPSRELAGTYGGGPKASVQNGTRTVHEYGVHPQYPEDVAYIFGGTKYGEDVSIYSGNGIELWRGPYSSKNIEEQLKKHNFKAAVGADKSIGHNQVAIRDPSLLFSNFTDKKTSLALLGANNAQQDKIRAYHGSPHDFDRFDLSKIGTGEGAQAYGHGLYFAENPAVARDYRSKLSMSANVGGSPVDSTAMYYLQQNGFDKAAARAALEKSLGTKLPDTHMSVQAINSYNPGRMYEVNINARPDQFLDWDKPLMQQPENVRGALADRIKAISKNDVLMPRYMEAVEKGTLPGNAIYEGVAPGGRQSSTDALRAAGVPGIKYLDQGSRTAGQGSSNYVVFDDKLIDILRKYGIALPGAGAGVAAAQDNNQ
jgi:hypothetical protein